MNQPTLRAAWITILCSLFIPIAMAMPPDDWKRFTAYQQQKIVHLLWETNAEYGSKDFLVQHSIGGHGWTNIGTLPAAGTSGVVQSYRFAHQTPSDGINHYRIVLLDENGRAHFSKIVLVDYHATGALLIYPNPVVNGNLTVQLAKESDVTIFTRNGKAVLQKHCSAGKTILRLNELPGGLYQVKAGDEVQQFFIR